MESRIEDLEDQLPSLDTRITNICTELGFQGITLGCI